MYKLILSIRALIVLLGIAIILFLGFGALTIINFPRIIIRYKPFKTSLASISNYISNVTVSALTVFIQFMHQKRWKVIDNNKFSKDNWYLATSNHQSWGDVFIVLAAANYKVPFFKIFMKKDLWWLPPVFLANATLNMPFVNRHSKEELEKNPGLRFKDYNNTIASCKRFARQPTTIFSFAEGTRNTKKKHKLQDSPYRNLLKPKIGGIATALCAFPKIEYLIDYTLKYKSTKRSFWDFLMGDLSDAKVIVKKYKIPSELKNKNYINDENYRKDFRNWVNEIWKIKDDAIDDLKF